MSANDSLLQRKKIIFLFLITVLIPILNVYHMYFTRVFFSEYGILRKNIPIIIGILTFEK